MDTHRADENLRVIRSLLERTTLYRRSLAPVLLSSGVGGLLAGVGGWLWQPGSALLFGIYWYAVAVVLVALALALVSRQAHRSGEAMWSPPARRVVGGLTPAFVCGLALGIYRMLGTDGSLDACWHMLVLWLVFYGCGLQASALFLPRELRLYGWCFAVPGLLLGLALALEPAPPVRFAHLLTGASFGGLNLVFGARLAWLEKGRSPAEAAE